jgi:uncharacterized protein
MIDVRNIRPNESAAVGTTVEIAVHNGFGAYDVAVAVTGSLKNAIERFELEARGNCRLRLVCSRCLEPVEHQLSFHISENFVEEEKGVSAADDGEDILFRDKTIDIFPAVQRNLFLNIPMKPLCGEDCAGLCPKCGKNLNEGDCDCEGEIVNEQFRELMGMMFED